MIYFRKFNLRQMAQNLLFWNSANHWKGQIMKIAIILLIVFLGCLTAKNKELSQKENEYINIDDPAGLGRMKFKDPSDRKTFVYSRYQPTSFKELSGNSEQETASKGVKIFNAKKRLILNLLEYPMDGLNEDDLDQKNGYAFLNQSMMPMMHLYNSKLCLKYNDQKFLFLFQSQLVPYLKREVKKGETVALYGLYATYNEFSNLHLILVNEFHKQ